jgi:hypothetical protein
MREDSSEYLLQKLHVSFVTPVRWNRMWDASIPHNWGHSVLNTEIGFIPEVEDPKRGFKI